MSTLDPLKNTACIVGKWCSTIWSKMAAILAASVRIVARAVPVLGKWFERRWNEFKVLLGSLPRLAAMVVLAILAICFAQVLINQAKKSANSLGSKEMTIHETYIFASPSITTNQQTATAETPRLSKSRKPATLPYALAIISLLLGFGISAYAFTVVAKPD